MTCFYQFPKSYFNLELNQITDSALLRVEHNWVAPDPLFTSDPAYTLSDSRYWKIDGILPATFDGNFRFYYNNKENGDGWLDYSWFPYPLSADSLALLYRPGTWAEWQEIPSEKLGNSRSGYLKTTNIAKGEYCMAYRDLSLISSLLIQDEKKILVAFPNPSKEIIHIRTNLNAEKRLTLYDSRGLVVHSKKMDADQNNTQINASKLGIGVYFLELMGSDKTNAKIKVVVSR